MWLYIYVCVYIYIYIYIYILRIFFFHLIEKYHGISQALGTATDGLIH